MKELAATKQKMKLVVAGLGPGAPEEVPPRVIEECLRARKVFLRTERHPSVIVLKDHGVSYISFDFLYETAPDFSTLYSRMAQEVLSAAEEGPGSVVYLVPGNPLVAERSVEILLEKAGSTAEVIGARSFAEVVLEAARVPAPSGYVVLDAYEVSQQKHPPYYAPDVPHVIGQVHDKITASWVKLYLMEFLPPSARVFVVKSAGIKGSQSVREVQISSLDMVEDIDHLTAVVVPAAPAEDRATSLGTWLELLSVVAELRSEHGCPWDREQTHESLIPFALEEAYELAAAILSGRTDEIVEELGDLLLQIVLHIQIGREQGRFSERDVISGIIRKLIFRHPHVFGHETISAPEDVVRRWEQIKRQEKHGDQPGSLMDSVGGGLPSLLMAQKQQVLAASVGFDWERPEEVLEKVKEEIGELEKAMKEGSQTSIGEEIGDVLYAVVNLSRHLGQDAETCLRRSVDKFSARFKAMEEQARAAGVKLEDLDQKTLDDLWNAAKSWKDLDQKSDSEGGGQIEQERAGRARGRGCRFDQERHGESDKRLCRRRPGSVGQR